jgi:hypothetical protein
MGEQLISSAVTHDLAAANCDHTRAVDTCIVLMYPPGHFPRSLNFFNVKVGKIERIDGSVSKDAFIFVAEAADDNETVP